MIKHIQIEENQILNIQFLTGAWIQVPFVWLRDHCQCPECYHTETKQRLVDVLSFPEELEIKDAKVSKDLLSIMIEWKHTPHKSEFKAELFQNLRSDPENLNIKHNLWTSRSWLGFHPYVNYTEFMSDDNVLQEFLEFIEEFGFSFIEGVTPTEEGTKEVCDRIAYTRQTIFGGYYEMSSNLEHKDTAYTSLAIGPHTDGTYSNDAPSYQVLHCLEENCEGAINILIDGFKIAQIMKNKYTEDFTTLAMTPVPGQYIDLSKGIHLMARRPIFRLNDQEEIVQISYNNHDRAPFLPSDPENFYRALNTFARLVNNPDFQYRRKLLPGSVLFFDNWRVLHAREAYSGYRKLAGVYFNKEDVESKLRVLRSRNNKTSPYNLLQYVKKERIETHKKCD